MKVKGILETAIYTGDLKRAEDFYTKVLGLEVFSRAYPRHVFFKCGGTMFLLFNPDVTGKEADSPHGASGVQHVAFSVPMAELDAWREHLEQNEVAIRQDMIWPNGSHSLYFNDPDGNNLELASPMIWNLPDAI